MMLLSVMTCTMARLVVLAVEEEERKERAITQMHACCRRNASVIDAQGNPHDESISLRQLWPEEDALVSSVSPA